MNELGIMLTASGMGGVFVVLSILAFVMWAMGRFFGKKATSEESDNFSSLTDLEVLAVTAAILQYEGTSVVEVHGPENWKRLAKIYAGRWLE
ncbi:OadG family protein [Archaeoglobus neptunius]|uniref:OadG family protein n=1 Tax=Archaeoglobus neptunius TaxID=2798580 RepID=UPI001925A8FC|nr:OadG family transporter subunit [Archaeoglobus neptunius]